MAELFHFSAQLNPSEEEGKMTARIVPFGAEVPYGKETIRFERGGLEMPAAVPLTVDHGDSVLDRIGVLSSFAETDDGAYATFTFSDTQKAQDVRTLLADGAVSDVSVGVSEFKVQDGIMSGVLDHTAVVTHGRFGKTQKPSKVLSVHDEGEPPMAEAEVATPEVATHNDELVAQFNEMAKEITTLREEIDTNLNRVVSEPKLFSSIGDFVKTQVLAEDNDPEARDRMAKHAMSADTTTTGAGVVPDYLSSELLTVLATNRAFINSIPNDPAGSAGMTVSYPTWGTKPTVTAQSSQLDQPSSTTTSVTTTDYDLVTYAGANRVAKQLIKRSQPSFVTALMRELVSAYNKVTDKAAIDTVLAARTAAHTAVVADLSASLSATFAAFNAANTAIIADMRRPADTIWLAPDKWAEVNALVDGDGRPALIFPGNGPSNSYGESGLNRMRGTFHGWDVICVPDATAATVLIGISDAPGWIEDAPEQISVTNVDTLSMDFGIWGLGVAATKYPNAFYDITEA